MSRSCHNTLVGTFGAIQIDADGQAISFDTIARHYDTAGTLRIEHFSVRMPLAEAYQLLGLLALAVGIAEEAEPRQTDLWGHIKAFCQVRE